MSSTTSTRRHARDWNRVWFRNAWEHAMGLRFRQPMGGTLYIFDFGTPVRHAFSMWFVFHAIDAFFLDEEGRVLECKRDFKPFTLYRPKHSYAYAVETVPGLLDWKVGRSVASLLSPE